MSRDAEIVGETLARVLPATDKYWFQQSHLLQLNLLLLVPLLSSSVSGYDGSLMNGMQSLQQWKDDFGDPQGARLGVVNAAQSIGSILFLPFVGHLSDRFGRKRVMLSGILMVCASAAIQAASVNYAMFVVSRVLVGFGGMLLIQPAPLLIAELSYPTHRGKYTAAFNTLFYSGSILGSWTTFGTQVYRSSISWRIPSALQAVYPLIQLIFLYWVPESPRWLVAQDRAADAAAILTKFHDPLTPNSPLVQCEMSEIVDAIQKDASQTTWLSLIDSPGNRRRMLIAVLVGIFSQWNGIGVVGYYLTLVLDSVGIADTFDQTLINGLLQIFNFAIALGAAFLVDHCGRRVLFIWSGIGMFFSYVIWTACSAVNTTTGSKPTGIVVVVCLFFFNFHYDIAWTPLAISYPTEIFPYALRSKGLAVELIFIYTSLFVSAFLNPIGIENIGWKYYIVYCCFLAIFFVVSYLLFPETKGYSLEEIAQIFDGLSDEEGKAKAGGHLERGNMN